MWSILRPVLFRLDAEKAHRLTLGQLSRFPRLSATVLGKAPVYPQLKRTMAGLPIASPIGLAAGLDKDGEAISVWPNLGFGFIEVGTVTAHPQKGNPQPRLFRLPQEKALINRMGFNNHGSEHLAQTLRNLHESNRWPTIPVGANIGKSKITPLEEAPWDYKVSTERLQPFVDYFTVNVSSPNTPGLRTLQSADKLKLILEPVMREAKGKPVFVKFAPDMHAADLCEAIDATIDMGCSGIIATNTTNTRPQNTDRLQESGGLSGAPLWSLAQQQIQIVLNHVAQRVPVIGVGGVDSADKAQLLLDMGCAAVQLYTALIYRGPTLIRNMNRKLNQNQERVAQT
ncbi:MAG: quinone-dependent dihydroorotate dehydrogenase [Myxococcota bacterium]|nr:quinone-dependent dihydroorotate dehydrogenase [Myxococcota bacterium]